MKYILSFNSEFFDLCSLQLKKVDPTFEVLKLLDENTMFCNCALSNGALVKYCNNGNVTFVRHITKVEHTFENAKQVEDFCKQNLNKDQTYTLQVRHFESNFKDLLQNINLEEFSLDVKNAQQIVSVVCHQSKIFVGLGNSQTNLCSFKGGQMHFSTINNYVCRAQFKLEELFLIYPFPKMQTAVDFGSAPGGWAWVLANKNISVLAVDPALLDQKVYNHRNVKHIKKTVERLAVNVDKFDIITNDMKMDPIKSIALTKQFSKNLNNGGHVVITLKLSKQESAKAIEKFIYEFKQGFDLIMARSIFHNRHEITLVGTKKQPKLEA